MNLFELTAEYHDELCPDLWDNKVLKPEVKKALNRIADAFIEAVGVNIPIEDVVFTGSLANYNWNPHSDIDIHVVYDLDTVKNNCAEFTTDFFDDKRSLFNANNEITVYGRPVELYAQGIEAKDISTGMYSLKNDKWVIEPKYSPPDIDEKSVEKKTDEMRDRLKRMMKRTKITHDQLDKLMDKIKDERKKSLTKDGEFGVGNLAFKELRNDGTIEKLVDKKHKAFSDELSLKDK